MTLAERGHVTYSGTACAAQYVTLTSGTIWSRDLSMTRSILSSASAVSPYPLLHSNSVVPITTPYRLTSDDDTNLQAVPIIYLNQNIPILGCFQYIIESYWFHRQGQLGHGSQQKQRCIWAACEKIVAALETFEIYSNIRNIRGRVLVPPLLLWIPDTRLVRSKKECG